MKSYLKYLIGCLGLLLLLPACKNESDVEEATIDVSTQLMTFTKEGGEQTLTVKTNKDTWTAFTTQESWLTLTQEGNALKVKASANDRGVDRSASIIVNAGGAQRRVAVTQSAADGLIEMTDTSVLFPKAGATKKVTFSSNGGAVKAELATPADWLTIDRVADGSIVLTAKESTEKYRRRVKVLLTVGTTLTEIEAIQEGSVQYVLPILKFPASLATVMSEEMARGNALIQLPDGLFNTTSYRVATRSEAMPFIQYEFTDPSAPGFKSAMSICADSMLVKDNPEFMAFVKEQGFDAPTISKDGKTTTYTSESLQLQIEVTIQPKGAVITTTYRPTQRKSYKTFDVMPLAEQLKLLSSRELDIMKAKRAEIRKQEAEWGSEWAEPHDRKYYDRFMVTKALTVSSLVATSISSLTSTRRSPKMIHTWTLSRGSRPSTTIPSWPSGVTTLATSTSPMKSSSSSKTMAIPSCRTSKAIVRLTTTRRRSLPSSSLYLSRPTKAATSSRSKPPTLTVVTSPLPSQWLPSPTIPATCVPCVLSRLRIVPSLPS